MKKILITIITVLLLASCSTKNFYAYEKGNDYCTIEEDKNRTVVYRGTLKKGNGPEDNFFDYMRPSKK